MIRYPIGDSGQTLVFHSHVVEHFLRYRQHYRWAKEAGGQLFAVFDQAEIKVIMSTGPRLTDQRTRYSYIPDRKVEQAEIDYFYKKGLHFIGDWHTHAERVPVPSSNDLVNAKDCVVRSTHALQGFVFVIVGTAPPPDGLFVGIALSDGIHPLVPPNPH